MKATRHIARRNFTLVELLVVVVIIAIILGITAPAFSRLLVGNSVDSAARMVSSQLMLARAEAIARRRCVAVIMPAKDISVPADNNDVYNRQAFRAAYVTGSGSDYTFEEWVPGTQWSFLPKGAVIAALDNENTSIKKDADDEWIPDADWTVADGSVCSVNDGSEDDAKIFKGKSNSSVRAVVFKPNGRAALRSYVTVMEGLCADNDSDIERENRNNMRVMEINTYTGQVRYIY